MEELKSLLRSHGGDVLINYLYTIEKRLADMVQSDARTKDLGDIRYAAGRREGVEIVIQNLKELVKNA
jgi:hypothetical protein